jgi:hypothetical protein
VAVLRRAWAYRLGLACYLVLTAAGGALLVGPPLLIRSIVDGALPHHDVRLLADRGTHEELLARGGLYAELHATQFRAA